MLNLKTGKKLSTHINDTSAHTYLFSVEFCLSEGVDSQKDVTNVGVNDPFVISLAKLIHNHLLKTQYNIQRVTLWLGQENHNVINIQRVTLWTGQENHNTCMTNIQRATLWRGQENT